MNKLDKEIKKILKFYNKDSIKDLTDVDWYNISYYQKLSEEFIRKFKDKVNWYSINYYQKLSEEFIREFKDRVYWYNISKYQKLSEGFIIENIKYIDIGRLKYNKNIKKKLMILIKK